MRIRFEKVRRVWAIGIAYDPDYRNVIIAVGPRQIVVTV